MKKHLLVVVGLLLGMWQTAMGQEVSVVIEPLTQNFPSQVASYLDNPFRYARVRVINNTAVQQKIYLTLQMTAQIAGGNETFGIYSEDRGTSRPSITVAPGGMYVLDSREAFIEHFSGRLQLNLPQGGLNDFTQVPEGIYNLCVQACRWSEVVSVDQRMGEGCLPMNICYTGSAPEFTAPVMAGMGNNMQLQPQRNINIRWSDVITNCATSARFRYVLKIVKVLPGQNILQAIDRNPVFFSEDCGSSTFCVIDTLRDLRIPFEAGATYAMRVTAVQRNNMAGVQINLGNGGASQVVTFTWGQAGYGVEQGGEDPVNPQAPQNQQNESVEESDSDNQASVRASVTMPGFVAPRKEGSPQRVGKGDFAVSWTPVKGDSVKGAIYVVELYEDNLGGIDPSTVHAPLGTATVNGPVGHFYGAGTDTVVVKDKGWDTLLVEGAKYFLKLRTHTAYSYHSAHHRRVTHYVNGIPADTEEDSVCTVHDAFVDEETSLSFQWGVDSSQLAPIAPSQFLFPVNYGSADWDDTTFDAFGMDCPEVERFDDFEFMWKKTSGLDIGDSAKYTLYIYDMPKGKKLADIVKGKPKYTVENLTATTYNDSILDSLETGKSYVVRLRTGIVGDTLPKYKMLGDGYSHAIYFKLVEATKYSEFIDTKFACFPQDTTGLDRTPVKVDVDHLVHDRVRLKMGRFDLIVQKATDKPATLGKKDGKKGDKKDGDKKEGEKKEGDKGDKGAGDKPAGDKGEGDKGDKGDKGGEKKDGEKKDGKKDGKKGQQQEYSVISGEGYILWHPLGFGCGVKVKFDTVKVNKNNQVISGTARTIATDSNNYINLNIGDNKFGSGFDMLSDGAAAALDKVAGELGSTGEEVRKWYNYINLGSNTLTEVIHGIAEEELNVGVVTTPIRIPQEMLGLNSNNVTVAINDMFFSPVTAHANYLAFYSSHRDNMYMPFVVTNVCVDSSRLIADTVGDVSLVLAADMSFPLVDNYTLSLKRPTKLTDLETGTHITINQKGFKELVAVCEVDFGYRDVPGNKLLAVDMKKDGGVDPSKSVKGTFVAHIEDWDNWTATVKLDPFTVVGCEDYTFVPSGEGILYDHSSTFTPPAVRFPADYLKNAKDEKERKSWQGFYLDKFYVMFPPSVSTVFIDYAGEEHREDKPVYHYGANGEQTDSVEFIIPGSRLSGGAERLIWDGEGLSVDVNIADILTLETRNGGGWLFSLDTAGLRFQKSKFKYGQLTGRVRVPLFSGNLRYHAQLGTDSLAFKVNLDDKDFKLQLYVADVALDQKSSYFTIVQDNSGGNNYTDRDKISGTEYTCLDSKSHTRIDLTLNGKININFKQMGIDAELPAIKFEKMYVRNFTRKDVDMGQKGEGNASGIADSEAENKAGDKGDKGGDKGGKGGRQKNVVKSYVMGPIDFSIGKWSKASPQKYLGEANPDTAMYDDLLCFADKDKDKDDKDKDKDKDKKITGKVGGLEYSIDTVDMVFNRIDGQKDKYRAGLAFAGSLKLGIGASQSVGAAAGFTVLADVNTETFEIGNFDGAFDSARITTNIGPLAVDGFLAHTRDDSLYGNSWRGVLQVKVMKAVDVAMGAGFGTSKRLDGSTYDWWFFEGAMAMEASPFTFGPLTVNGFGGGFAYNMITANHGQHITADKLMEGLTEGADENGEGGKLKSITGQMVHPSGLSFKPQYDAWVAKAGISMILTGSERTLNGVGQMNLRMANGHFAGITLQMTASIISDYNVEKKKAANSVLEAAALIDFVDFSAGADVDTGWALSFSFCAKSELKFDKSFLKDEMTSKLTDGLWYPGSSEDKDPKTGKKSSISDIQGKWDNADEDAIKAKLNAIKEGEFEASATMQLPVDLYVRNYGTGRSPRTNEKNDWYFALGRPEYDKRVSCTAKFDLAVLKGKATFTSYLIAGNAPPGGIKLPDLPADVQKFFSDHGMSGKIHNGADLPEVKDAGGFALGFSFQSKITYDLFLYLDVDAFIGLDVALLYSQGMACEDGTPVGRNGYYAMGQAYAMLNGSVGLSLDLGFWKGKLTLAEAGVGALLQAGGPNPTWCYGLLGFSASVLGGVARINTSVDFSLGHVCIPGASDPLANVKLFQSVQPGYPTSATAKQAGNLVNPLSEGVIVSNLPWNEDVLLCAQERGGKTTRDRKFRFMLDMNGCYDNAPSRKSLSFRRARTDANTLYFENTDGAFIPSTSHEVHLRARAFEYRTSEGLSAYGKRYDNTFTLYESSYKINSGGTYPDDYMWRNPTFDDKGTTVQRIWTTDTVVYFNTEALPANLRNQVVFTWPYNGDPNFPIKETYYDESRKRDVVPIFLYAPNPSLSSSSLSSNGERLKAFLLRRGNGGSIDRAVECECEYRSSYAGSSQACLLVILPRNFHGEGAYINKDLAVTIYRVKQSDYDKSLKDLMATADNTLTYSVKKEQQTRSNIDELRQQLNDNYAQGNGGLQQGGEGQQASQQVNLERTQLQTVVDDYNSRNDTTLNYTRKGLAANYQAAVSSGSPIYTLYFHTIKSDYKHLLQNNNMAELVPNGGYTYSATFSDAFINGYHTRRSPGSKIMPYAYLFCEYEPNDSAMYRIGTVLPPVCYLGLDRDNDADKVRLPEYQLYDVFSRELVTLDRAVRDTRVPTQRPKMSCNGGKEFCGGTAASKVWQYNWNSNAKVRNVSTAFTNGLVEVSPGSLWFKHLELRVVMDNNIWTNMNSNTRAIRYYNDGVINRYPAATLLWFKEDSRKKRIDSTYFYGMMNDAPTHAPSTIVFYDEATSTILNDLELMAKLFNRIVGAGRYMHASVYSKKSSEADFILNRPNNRLAVPSGVPVTIPKSVLHCWYFNAFNATVTANITDKKELTFKNVGTISRYKMRQYSDVGNMVYSWQDHVVHYNTMPYEMDRTRGTISEEGLLWNKTKYKSSRDVWWDYQGLVTSQAIDKYRMFYNVRNARVYTYWRTLNGGNMLSRVVSAVRTREDGERIFLATDRRTNPDFSYSYTLGSTLITTYEKYSNINSYWSDKTNWFEK